jgi:hypothetical protein
VYDSGKYKAKIATLLRPPKFERRHRSARNVGYLADLTRTNVVKEGDATLTVM